MNQVLTCNVCKKVWERPPQRGRLPSICADCKPEPTETEAKPQAPQRAKLSAQERVDRLEMLLRANNVHIQQHSKDDETS